MSEVIAAPVEEALTAAAADAIFLSDVHLSAEDPVTESLFLAFLEHEVVGKTRHLYILGDLFEYWAGDDDHNPFTARVLRHLKSVVDRGVAISFMAGNRDFLIDGGFSEQTGVEIIADPTVVVLAGQSYVLCHGDTLCTDDVDYQNFRQVVRAAAWQESFLAQSLDQRRTFIENARRVSGIEKQAKSQKIMDVNGDAVAAMLAQFPDSILIHGHTHRPAHHLLEVDGVLRHRWVLPDWDAKDRSVRGGAISVDRSGINPLEPGLPEVD